MLDELTPMAVFEQLLAGKDYDEYAEEKREELRATFAELLRGN